jgi:hypothetical protein
VTARRRLATLVFGRNEREYPSSSKRKRSHCENDPLLRTNEANHPRPPDGIVLSDLQREIRSASLRFVALSILFANLVFGDDPSGMTTHIAVSLVYLVVSVASVVAAMHFATREDLKAAFVALDAILVAVILHEHILASPITDNHNLTTSSLVVAFVLLNHVALKLDQRLITLVFDDRRHLVVKHAGDHDLSAPRQSAGLDFLQFLQSGPGADRQFRPHVTGGLSAGSRSRPYAPASDKGRGKAHEPVPVLACALDRWRVANASTGGPFLEVGIGLHCRTVIGGVLERGFHDEFTVIGDVVNVAQRLEGLAKSLKAPLVVSEALLQEVPGEAQNSRWLTATNVKLAGRREPIDIAFLQSAIPIPLETPTSYEIGERQTDP